MLINVFCALTVLVMNWGWELREMIDSTYIDFLYWISTGMTVGVTIGEYGMSIT